MSKETHVFYGSALWKNCRASYLKSVGGLCELCKAEGIITPAEEVHHRIKLDASNVKDPNITLSWSNLQALCRRHHDEIHGRAFKRRCHFDNMGRCIIDE